jgi:catechol 2,3-dioxygenase-like lactoylglutathione lyase family enzyme
MLGSESIIVFVPAADLARSRRFYEETLGLTVDEVTPFACVLRAGDTMLRITKVGELRPQPFTIAGWAVPEIRHLVRDLAARGVQFTRYDGMGQDADGVWATPGGDLVAWFTDPDGNTLSLTQFAGRPGRPVVTERNGL